jgi:hypothetical protein
MYPQSLMGLNKINTQLIGLANTVSFCFEEVERVAGTKSSCLRELAERARFQCLEGCRLLL